MNSINTIFDKLEDSERQQVFQFAEMLTDPMTRRIMAKLASTHSPITTDKLPIDLLKGSKAAIISRLSRLKRAGIISSESVESEDGFCKRYSINENGEELVSKYMHKESLQFK